MAAVISRPEPDHKNDGDKGKGKGKKGKGGKVGKGGGRGKGDGSTLQGTETQPKVKTAQQEAKQVPRLNACLRGCVDLYMSRVFNQLVMYFDKAIGIAAAAILECKSWKKSLRESDTPAA